MTASVIFDTNVLVYAAPAAILAAAEALGTDTVYSEDFSHGQRYGRVRVINPFA